MGLAEAVALVSGDRQIRGLGMGCLVLILAIHRYKYGGLEIHALAFLYTFHLRRLICSQTA